MSSESESDEPDGPLAGLDPATAGAYRRSWDYSLDCSLILSMRRPPWRLSVLLQQAQGAVCCSCRMVSRLFLANLPVVLPCMTELLACARDRMVMDIPCSCAMHSATLPSPAADALDLRDRFSDLATAGQLNEALTLVRAVVRANRSDVLIRCAVILSYGAASTLTAVQRASRIECHARQTCGYHGMRKHQCCN